MDAFVKTINACEYLYDNIMYYIFKFSSKLCYITPYHKYFEYTLLNIELYFQT